ncbi:TPA: hypothetical protein DCY43_04405, partial [candidate division WWE3 bacterium]|nr:hypothetical protein [candidate division WWE3 bacterium]
VQILAPQPVIVQNCIHKVAPIQHLKKLIWLHKLPLGTAFHPQKIASTTVVDPQTYCNTGLKSTKKKGKKLTLMHTLCRYTNKLVGS